MHAVAWIVVFGCAIWIVSRPVEGIVIMDEPWKVEMRYTVTATKSGKTVTYGFSNDEPGAQALLAAVNADPAYKSGKIIDNGSDAPADEVPAPTS